MLKLKLSLIAFLLIAFVAPISAHAEEKTVTVRLDRSYVSCAFTVHVDEAGEYAGYIIDPGGGRYNLLTVDETTLTCVVEKPVSGNWQVEVSAEGAVPKFSVKVNASAPESSYNPDQTIRVGKDIPGLDVHFIDGNVEATWDDSDISGVKVTVTKLDNNQVLDSSVTKELFYRCDVPAGTQKVYVTVVPAESANIEGIARSFTLNVPKAPDIKVMYADEGFVHTPSEKISLSLGSNKFVSCAGYCNDELVMGQTEILTGDMEVEIPLAEDGVNMVVLSLKDGDGNYWTYSNKLIKDSEPPRVTFNMDYDGLTLSDPEMYIEGRVYDTTELFIGTEQVFPSTDGFFSHKCSLHEGENELTVKAFDAAGNLSQFNFVITRGAAAKAKTNSLPLIEEEIEVGRCPGRGGSKAAGGAIHL